MNITKKKIGIINKEMNLQENIQRIKEVMNLNESSNDNYTQKINNLENVLNRKMPEQFPWWKKINLKSYSIDQKVKTVIRLTGSLTIDVEWAAKQWRNVYMEKPFPEYKEPEDSDYIEYITLGDIITDEEYYEISQHMMMLITLALGTNIGHLRGLNDMRIIY